MEKQKNGSYKYSFLNPADEEKILEKWGGKTFVMEKYPAVWNAVQRTKEYEREAQKKENGEGVDGYVTVGCPNFPEDVCKGSGPAKRRLSALISMRLEDGTYDSGQASIRGLQEPKSRKWPYAMLTGNIINITDSATVAHLGKEYYNKNSVDEELASDSIYDGTDFTKKRVETFATYSGIDFNDVVHMEKYHVENPNYSDEEGSALVHEFIVKQPYSEHANNPIKILYDREPGGSEVGTIDKSYKNVRDNNMVKTCIPIAAQLQFADHIVPATIDTYERKMDILDKDNNFLPQLYFGNPMKKRVVYNRGFDTVKKFFTRNEHNLEIDFTVEEEKKQGLEDYWKTSMSVNNYTTGDYEVGRTVELHATFYINLMNEKYKTYVVQGISIVSVSQDKLPSGFQYYLTNDGMTVYVPPINIRWGCFASGTRVAMANGEKKPVEMIEKNDILYTTTGPAKVNAVYLGREEILLCICTESGKSLKVTYTHPIVLAGGRTVQARNVRPGQYVMTEKGEEDKVKWVFDIDYHSFVYNFEFTDGKEHVVEANGILAGEFISQNSYKNDTVYRQHITPQTQALTEQFSALNMELEAKFSFNNIK